MPLSRPLAGRAQFEDGKPDAPVAVIAIGQQAGETVFVTVDRYGVVDTVSELNLRITDPDLQRVAIGAETPAEAAEHERQVAA